MLATPKKPVAFNVEFDATVSTPDRILKKLKEAKERREMRRSLSRDEIVAKLETAAERKMKYEETRVFKAAQDVAHAKEIVDRKRQASEQLVSEQMEKLKEKLVSAAEKKGVQERMKKQKIEEHLEVVKARKDGAHDYKAEMTSKDIEGLLLAAESRRKAMEEAQKEKLAEHHRRVSMAKESVVITPKDKVDIDTKLQAAELRRKELEREILDKLLKKNQYAEEVRKRKSMAVVEGESVSAC